jgi:hypothetical protein
MGVVYQKQHLTNYVCLTTIPRNIMELYHVHRQRDGYQKDKDCINHDTLIL